MMIVLYSFIGYTLISFGLAVAMDDKEPINAKFLIDSTVFVIVVIVAITLYAVGFR